MQLLRFCFLMLWRVFCHTFYRYEISWVGEPHESWDDVRMYAFFNHTSLFEALFISAMPKHFIWRGCKYAMLPVADKSMNRPIVGKLLLLMAPQMVTITRKKDETWSGFLKQVDPKTIVCMAPEGRMKRKNGLDSNGQPMSVRGGISDILGGMDSGTMLIAYSGGLHHVQAPGEFRMSLFKTLKIRYEAVSIPDYKKSFGDLNDKQLKIAMVKDLEARMAKLVP